jgi:hypothetical protein
MYVCSITSNLNYQLSSVYLVDLVDMVVVFVVVWLWLSNTRRLLRHDQHILPVYSVQYTNVFE